MPVLQGADGEPALTWDLSLIDKADRQSSQTIAARDINGAARRFSLYFRSEALAQIHSPLTRTARLRDGIAL